MSEEVKLLTCPRCGVHFMEETPSGVEAIAAWNRRAADSPAATVSRDTGWLIEIPRRAGPEWFAVNLDDEYEDSDWTKDSLKALRFCRKEDADAYIEALGWTEARAVEHEWIEPRGKPILSALEPTPPTAPEAGEPTEGEVDAAMDALGIERRGQEPSDAHPWISREEVAAALRAALSHRPAEGAVPGEVEPDASLAALTIAAKYLVGGPGIRLADDIRAAILAERARYTVVLKSFNEEGKKHWEQRGRAEAAEAELARLTEVLEVREAKGIYIASKVRHARRWRLLRDKIGYPIISTWIDEAGDGQSRDFADLWRRCVSEAANAEVLVFNAEPGELFKGAWVELGAALGNGVPVLAVGLNRIEGLTIAQDPRIRHFPSMKAIMEVLKPMANGKRFADLSLSASPQPDKD